MSKPWRWVRALNGESGWILRDGRGRNRANVWVNGTWHTWDESGTGGENSSCDSVRDAMDQVIAAVVRQGWTPFKVQYARMSWAELETEDKCMCGMGRSKHDGCNNFRIKF